MDGGAFVNMLHAALNTTDCICNEAMKFSTTSSDAAIHAANTFDDKRGIFNRGRVMEIQIPCGAPRSSGSLLFAGVCMQLDVHDAPLSDKMDGLYGPHTFTPLTARGRARACEEGRGLHGRAPGERESERPEQCWLLMNRSDFITPRLLHGHGYS